MATARCTTLEDIKNDETLVIYNPRSNDVNFYVDGHLSSRALFNDKMGVVSNGQEPIKLSDYAVMGKQMNRFVNDILDYSKSVKSKVSSEKNRREQFDKLVKKIVEKNE